MKIGNWKLEIGNWGCADRACVALDVGRGARRRKRRSRRRNC
jgi:hypothetical protein